MLPKIFPLPPSSTSSQPAMLDRLNDLQLHRKFQALREKLNIEYVKITGKSYAQSSVL